MGKPRRITPTDNWEQLKLFITSPEQEHYEEIRPIVLFGQPPSTRSRETGTPAHTLRRRADRFAEYGMASLFDTPPQLPSASPSPLPQALPPELCQMIIDLKVEHPPLRVYEIATICFARTGRRPHSETVKRILKAAQPLPGRQQRRFPPYHQIPDPAQRRAVVLRLHFEGWTKQSIAEYLETCRETVHATLRRYVAEGIGGLYPKSHAPQRRVCKVTLSAMLIVRRLQRNPGLGEFRIHAKLKQIGIHLSPRTCGRILALNRKLYADLREEAEERKKKPMPFAASRRHEYWTVDIRYLDMHRLGGGNIYAITILENYSRAILASAVSRTQDETAYLIVLYAAIRQHGCPEAIVSDGGAVFKATQAKAIYQALGIEHKPIKRRQSWQSYIETNFNVMRRMADWHFERATSWAELVAAHDQWVGDFNYQVHYAHIKRSDNRHSPAEVLSWIRGRVVDEVTLHKVFHTTRFVRHLDRGGYLQFRHWRMYAEQGVARQSATVWLYAENLTIAYHDQPLAHYTVAYEADQQTFKAVSDPQLIETAHRVPQLALWDLTDDDWHKIVPPLWLRPPPLWAGTLQDWMQVLPRAPMRHPRSATGIQERLAL
jgi:putative transposase